MKGESYRWIAYSYNRDNSVPLPDITDPSAPNISTGEGYDLLYATDTVHVSNSGVTPLGIVFKHKLSRIAVELNTMGMFADLNSAEITFAGNYFGKGTLDLFTGQITNTESYSSIPVDTSFQREPGYEYGDRNVAYCY
ncbi:fimbrillin family protein, partial [Escherichia coli]|uniref:fimbrillin family protein n=1 Tax=Escherichia coli TaxID=562 RepID=UPI001C6103D5